jgi:hypothetical protein
VKRLRGLLLAGLAFTVAAPALAADSLDLAKIAGVYKRGFQNADVSGRQYRSEDVVEIVPLDRTSAYVRVRLNFFNGHLCAIYGVAHPEAGALVYRPPPEPGRAGRCALGIRVDRRQLSFDDPDGACRESWCGVRGGFAHATLPAASRRPIRYMARLRASREFRHAIAEAAKP